MGILIWQYGWQGAFTQMGWFFTKAALLTFGGAYAVLPYVYQGAVEHYQWLTATQMIDGLALGETTPGPLIMVVTFVGFLAGWNQLPLGIDAQLLAAVIAASSSLIYLPAQFLVHPGRWAIGGIHPRQLEIHRAAFRHHRCGRRRNPQSGGIFCLARVLAEGFQR